MTFLKGVLLGAIALQAVGCATITHDGTQPVQVTTLDKSNNTITGAYCVLKNDRGEWNLKSQGSANVHRSAANLTINCTKDGQPDGVGTLISRANGGMFGNILLGGGIGAIIDHNKGTAYNYPDWVKIIMGDNLIFDRKNQTENQAESGTAAIEPAAHASTSTPQ